VRPTSYCIRLSFLALVIPLHFGVASAAVQSSSGGCNVYVAPWGLFGNSGRDIDEPLPTIGSGIQRAQSLDAPAIVVVLPGIYGGASESFPLQIPEGVSIQGTSAMNTVLVGRNGQGMRVNILEFSQPIPGVRFENTTIDGLMFVEANKAIRIRSRGASFQPTISNCVFADVLTGVEIDSEALGSVNEEVDEDRDGLPENRPKIVNCTFADSFFGIVDLNAEAEPAVVNCLFALNSNTDLVSIDDHDVLHCAFSSARGPYTGPGRSRPIPHINTTNTDPFIGAISADATWSDYRLRPGSAPMVEEGISDFPLALPNGTTVEEEGTCDMTFLDYDCEGYGNPRIDGAEIDIGADEMGEHIVAGFVRYTTRFTSTRNEMTLFVNASNPLVQLWVQSASTLDYLDFPQPAPGARADGTIDPLPPVGFAGTQYIDVSGAVHPMTFVTIQVPGTITVPITSIPGQETRVNQQILSVQAGALALTNLQTCTIAP